MKVSPRSLSTVTGLTNWSLEYCFKSINIAEFAVNEVDGLQGQTMLAR